MGLMLGFGFFAKIMTFAVGVNLYVFYRLGGFLKIKRRLWFWLTTGLFSMSFFIAEHLEDYTANVFARMIYAIFNNWLGVLWITICCLLVYEILRLVVRVKIKFNDRIGGAIVVTVAAVLSIYAMINPLILKVRKMTIPGPVDINIAHIADLHIGCVSHDFFRKTVDKIAALKPDMVAITGDFIDSRDTNIEEVMKYLDTIDAPIFFAIGNHDRYVGSERVIEILRHTKVRVLRNEAISLDGVQVIGIDDSRDPNRVTEVLGQVGTKPDKFSVLLFHRPVGFKQASAAGIDLMLSGHVHHGQIFPFNYVVGKVHEYMGGLHRHNDSWLYVTSGAGTWGPRMRLGSRSEIALIQVRKAD